MNWNEQSGDAQPVPITGLMRNLGVVDAALLASRTRRGPAVYLAPECREGILEHLRSHRTEMGGLLIGRAYVAGTALPVSWGPLVSVERFLASATCRSSRVSLAMGTEIWDRARSLLACDGGIVVGWYHSHPNLGVFFSGTDRATQRAFFNQPYSVGLVIDPCRNEEAWFIGPDSTSVSPESVSAGSLLVMTGDRRSPFEKTAENLA